MDLLILVALFLCAWALPWFFGNWVIGFLTRLDVMDVPNKRSSHSRPVPRGGGLMVIVPILALWAATAMAGAAPSGAAWIVVLATPLAVVSWIDDRKGLPIPVRLGAQVVVVGLAVAAMAPDEPTFQGLFDPLADRLLTALLWIWFVNLFNFMDGIDGISGVETMTIGGGSFAVTLFAGAGLGAGALGLVSAGAALGFLRWNWPPAKVFLGDIGSVPLGFVLGWLLLAMAADGLWAAALILPLYYLADASITLGRRVIRRERFWQAHRSHFYQRAAVAVGAHRPVAMGIALANAGLVAAALASLYAPLTGLLSGCVVTAVVLIHLYRLALPGPPTG